MVSLLVDRRRTQGLPSAMHVRCVVSSLPQRARLEVVSGVRIARLSRWWQLLGREAEVMVLSISVASAGN